MRVKRARGYQRTSLFSRSVAMVVFAAGGMISHIRTACVFADENTIDAALLCSVELLEGVSGKGLDLSSLLQLQRIVHESTLYSVGLPLSWEDLFAPKESSEEGKAVPQTQGLGFLFRKDPQLEIKPLIGLPYRGLMFYGSEESSRMSFENISASKSGSALYSDEDLIFKNLTGGVNLSNCESLEEGGAIFAQGQVLFQNLGVVELRKNISSSEASAGLEFSGGGAVASRGSVLLSGNRGVQCIENVSKASGGAILSESTFLNETTGDVVFKKNFAERAGGAILAKQHVQVQGNLGNIQFEGNSAQYAGGAILCGSLDSGMLGHIDITDNLGSVCFTKNLSASKIRVMNSGEDYAGGGALWGKDISISSNLGDISFSENQGGSVSAIGRYVGGGAIFSTENTRILENSGTISFIRNRGQGLANAPIPSPEESKDEEKKESDETNTENLKIDTVTASILCASHGSQEGIENLKEDVRGGGAIFSSCVDIQNNKGHIGFGYNSGGGAENSIAQHHDLAIIGGGAILGTSKVVVRGNQSVAFLENFTSGVKDCGGAILSRDVYLEGNAKLEFNTNGSSFLGGAVCALSGEVHIQDHLGKVSFVENRTRYGGGAISAAKEGVIISGNRDSVEFKENVVFGHPASENPEENLFGRYSGGGAILAKKFVEIKDNADTVLFTGNRAGAFGGAILVGSLESSSGGKFGDQVEDEGAVLSITGNSGDVVFCGNSTSVAVSATEKQFGGGAIHTKELKISENQGAVSFLSNRSATGAAVRISDSGSVVLRALGGDITFDGNLTFDGNYEAIYFAGPSSRIQELSASSGKSIIFRDALTFEDMTLRRASGNNPNSPTLVLNSLEEGKEHTGTILFSRETSKIPQVAVLQGGTLALTCQAQLWLGGLKQEPKSDILMEAGTVLRVCEQFLKDEQKSEGREHPETPSFVEAAVLFPKASVETTEAASSSESIVLSNLSIDISSFASEINSEALPPKLILPEGSIDQLKNLRLKVVDVEGLGYENHSLLSHSRNISLVEFSKISQDSTTPVNDELLSHIDVDITLPEMSAKTYGHTGMWSSTRVEEGKLVVDWMPTGYNLNPEKQGSLVLNTLWGVSEDLRAVKLQQLSHNMSVQRMELDFSTNIWAAGIGTFSQCSSETKIDGFAHRVGGSIIGMDTQLIEDFLLGGSFSQCLGYTGSNSYDARNDHKSYIGSGYISILAGSWLLKGTFVYGHIANELKTNYSSLGCSSASWNSKGFLADAKVDYRYIINPRRLISAFVSAYVPFVEVEYVRVDLPEVQEFGYEARTFQPSRLENVAIPFGITLEQGYARGSRSEVNGFSVAYVLDVYRKQPETMISLPEAQFSWKGEGADVFRKALRAQINNDTEWCSYFSTHFGVNYEWREHMSTVDVNAGVRVIF